MKKSILLFFILLNVFTYGQMHDDIWLEAKGKAGFLAGHRSVMGHLAKEHAYAAEISCYFRPNNRKAWHKSYKQPLMGVTAFIGTVGNRALLGEYYGLVAFTSMPFVSKKRYVLSTKLGIGLAYTTKHFDVIENPLNNAIGSSINAQVSLGVENRFLFGDHSINLSFDMTHFSNASSQTPNLGLNLPFVGLGYGYRVKKAKDSIYDYQPFKKEWHFGFVAIGSYKEIYPTGGKKYPIVGLNLVARRIFKPKVGMEISLDFISKQAIMDYHSDVRKTQAEIIQIGVFAGYVLPYDNFHFILGLGAYVKDKFQPENALYNRVGIRYVFDNGINMNLVLKTHWGKADYCEYGIGYTFKR